MPELLDSVKKRCVDIVLCNITDCKNDKKIHTIYMYTYHLSHGVSLIFCDCKFNTYPWVKKTFIDSVT